MYEFEGQIHLAHLSNVRRREDQYLLRSFVNPRSTHCQPLYAFSIKICLIQNAAVTCDIDKPAK